MNDPILQAKIREEISKLEKQGVFAADPKSWSDFEYRAVGVRVEVALPAGAEVKPLQWNIDIINTRGCAVTFSDWGVEDSADGQRIFSFVASMRLPENVSAPADDYGLVATSFRDLCWFHGNEAVRLDYAPDTTTKVRKSAACEGSNDLGWYLPCRFADRLIDALGKANDFLLSGILEDAILYGVMSK